MPDINTIGQILAGNGAEVSVNGSVIAPVGTAAQWLTANTAAYQVFRDGAWFIEAQNVTTGQRAVLSSRGCNELVARESVWAAWLAGYGLFGNAVFNSDPDYPEGQFPLAGLSPVGTDNRGAAGPDGTVALTPDRHQGIHFELVPRRGTLGAPGNVVISPAPYGLCILSAQQAIWNGGSIGITPPALLPGAINIRYLQFSGGDWVVYWTDAYGLIAHRADNSTQGYVLATDAAYHHRIAFVNGHLLACWSTGVQEGPDETVLVDVWSQQLVDFEGGSSGGGGESGGGGGGGNEDDMKPSKVKIYDPIAPFATTGWELRVDDSANNVQVRVTTNPHPSNGQPSWFVEITNPAGGDKSGGYRAATVDPSQFPDDGGGDSGGGDSGGGGDLPPVETIHCLQTIWGTYLRRGSDGYLVQGATGDAVEFVDSDLPGLIGLKVGGYIVAAEPDGRLKADRTTVGDWEYFEKLEVNGGLQFRSHWYDKFISAHDDGTTVACDQTSGGTWETLTEVEAATAPPVSAVRIDNRCYREVESGAPWRARGFSGFKLARLLTDGQDVSQILGYFRSLQSNIIRVWDYTTWSGTGWPSPSTEQTLNAIRYFQSQGYHTYFTLLTSGNEDPAMKDRIEHAKDLVRQCDAASDLTGLIFEIGNEPRINKTIDVNALRSTLESSRFLFTSGEYADSAVWFGRMGDAHTPRDKAWPRKSHDLLEYFNGGGPSYKEEPATKVPWWGGEPIKPSEARQWDGQEWYNDEDHHDPASKTIISTPQDFCTYAAGCALMGGGAFFHYEGGKFGQMPDAYDQTCAEQFFRGLLAFPADVGNLYPYERIDEHGQTSRTYKYGPYQVRVRPVDGRILIGEGQ